MLSIYFFLVILAPETRSAVMNRMSVLLTRWFNRNMQNSPEQTDAVANTSDGQTDANQSDSGAQMLPTSGDVVPEPSSQNSESTTNEESSTVTVEGRPLHI